MRRPKRISRRELKARIQELNYETQSLKAEISRLQESHGRLLDRFNRLGTQIESLDSGGAIQAIEIKPIPFGQYAIPKFLLETQCSVCKKTYVGDFRTFNFCPKCGARMDGEARQDET